jgi:hypothetical protein
MATGHNKAAQTDFSEIARALADSAELVGVALLGKPSSKSGAELRWGRHGSVSMQLSGAKRGLWHDFERGEGGNVLDLIAHEHGVGLGDAIRIAERDFLGGAEMRPPPRAPHPSAPAAANDTEVRIKAAMRIWRETVRIGGTLAEHYLVEHRKLDVGRLTLDHALRWHGRKQAVIALMTDPVTGEPIGVHRTFLDAHGAKIERKMLGRQGVVRLSPDDSVTTGLGMAEGVEDGIAVLLSGWSPIWVATSAGALARFPVLPGIEALTLFADADEAGIRAAKSCAKKWRAAGREVCLVHGKGVSHEQ